MSTVQAFLLGVMVAWTPSLLLLVWYLRPLRRSEPEDQPGNAAERAALAGE